MKNLVPITTMCRAASGSTVDECIRDAISLSAHEGRDVEFCHEDHIYTVEYREIIASVIKSKRLRPL